MDMWYDYWNTRGTGCVSNTRNTSCGCGNTVYTTGYGDTAVTNCGSNAYAVGCTYGCGLDMAKLMNMLSKVDKKDLEKSMEIANKIMKSENKDEIIKNLKNNLN